MTFLIRGAVALTLLLAPLAAGADEIDDALAAALEAYRAGDVKLAGEELAYAQTLLSQKKAEGLSGLLPEALDGWTREPADAQVGAGGAAFFGGGTSATARYTGAPGDIEITMMADNPMVASMAAMFSNASMLGAMGRVKRINRQQVVLTQSGELQSLIDGRVMVTIAGSAPDEVKEAYFTALDLEAIKAF